VIACRSANVQTASTETDASIAVTLADASPLAAASASPSAATATSAPASATGLGVTPPAAARALPSTDHLLAPFRGTKARGFVAVTNTDRALPVDLRRRSVSLVAGEALDRERPVLVASFTKLWTAVAALRMIERGELSLDDTVKDTLPELASRPWSSSTLRELLTHTSLVPELDDKGGYYRRLDVDFSSPVLVLAKHVPRDWTEKRGVYKYRNSELAIVGAILAERSKVPVARALAREVFEPAGMKHAGLLVTTAAPGLGLDLTPMGPVRPQNFFTAGAGYASLDDLLAFFEALAGTELLTPASKALLFDGAADRGNGALGCWAYPFARQDGSTTRLVERPGSFGNVRLFSAFFPDEKRAVIAWTGDGIDIARPRTARGIGNALARAALE
jgi:D-alanyl-D-alanine carboxypeptidase